MGQLESTELGYECSGVVAKVGTSVQSLAVGDRVMATGDGVFSTNVHLPEFAACKIPDDMDFETAASIPRSIWHSVSFPSSSPAEQRRQRLDSRLNRSTWSSINHDVPACRCSNTGYSWYSGKEDFPDDPIWTF